MKLSSLLVSLILINPALSSSSADPISPNYILSSSPAAWTRTRLAQLHKALSNHDSITSTEGSVAQYLTRYLQHQHLTVSKQFVTKTRFNILAFSGRSNTTRTLLTSHLDTVPPFFRYRIEDDNQIWGRGVVDAKGAVAAQVEAFLQLREEGKVQEEGDVGLLFVVGEETGGDGMRAVSSLDMEWETVIFGEPTENKLACGHKGLLQCTVHTKGKTAHSGYPWLGRSAIEDLVKVLQALWAADLPSSKKFGRTTVNVGTISGGRGANVVPDTAEAMVAVRVAEGEPVEVRRILQKAMEDTKADLEVEWWTEGYPPQNMLCDIEGSYLSSCCSSS
jgi:acetylornithine deacetylase